MSSQTNGCSLLFSFSEYFSSEKFGFSEIMYYLCGRNIRLLKRILTMKVRLLKEAGYDFDGEKFTELPYEVFSTLVGETNVGNDDKWPKMVMFENKSDYIEHGSHFDIDTNKSVYVMKERIFCFLREEDADAAADSEKGKGE